jgi:hypothetical protein
MSLLIGDGEGSGFSAGVTDENQLKTLSVIHSIQHHNSVTDGNAYQVIGDFAAINNSTHTILQLVNDSSVRFTVITYLRISAVGLTGGTALPSATNYFQIGFGRTITAGGTAVIPVNMNQSSGNTASVTATDNNPTMTGTFIEADRWYIEANGIENTYYKDGSIVIGVGETMEVRVVSDHTAGTAYARLSFIMEPALSR